MQLTVRIAALGAVKSCNGKMRQREELVGVVKTAAGHERERTVELFRQGVEIGGQRRRYGNSVRGFRKVEQCPIDIEEQGPALQICRESGEDEILS